MTLRGPAPGNDTGQGIPAHERFVADLGIRFYASTATPASILRVFRDEGTRVLDLATGLSEEQGRRRVKIRRFPGLESSSCDWSAFMVLDHLVMVNTGVTALIHAICLGHEHDVEIHVMDVEPHADAGKDRLHALHASLERYTEVIERLGALRERECHDHPWFGPLTAQQWHALAAVHNRMHRVQIQKILRRLK